MISPPRVTVRDLERRDAERLLGIHHTGRMAFAFHNRVMMTLVNYVYSAGWIYARLEHGPALATLEHDQWVAFEVDEIIGVYDWRSVIVHGSVQLLRNDRSSSAWRDFNHALELLRGQVPSILTHDDPHPERVQVYRIHLDDCVARESTSSCVRSLPSA
jgi:nitroimidazol reductase NimA-like FMN-containing flavoprotein (pyridoxamine 5'-phosphate oxidase superfamily)